MTQREEDKGSARSQPVSALLGAGFDAEWPRALERLKHTEPHPDQGIACVGTADLEMALTRLEQFASVALGNAVQIQALMLALKVIGDASERSETMFGGSMSEVTRVFKNITRVARLHLSADGALGRQDGPLGGPGMTQGEPS